MVLGVASTPETMQLGGGAEHTGMCRNPGALLSSKNWWLLLFIPPSMNQLSSTDAISKRERDRYIIIYIIIYIHPPVFNIAMESRLFMDYID